MYSMRISLNQYKYFEFKIVLNIAVYAQTSSKLFAGPLVLRGPPVLSFDMLLFPKGDCLIQVWMYLAYFYVLHPQHIHGKEITNFLTQQHSLLIFLIQLFLIIRRVYMDVWHKSIFLLLYQVTQLILWLKIYINLTHS